jgi:hypothetical protein
MRDLVLLDYLQEIFVDELLHDVNWNLKLRCHGDGIQLAVCVIKWKKPDPSLWWVVGRVKWFVEISHVYGLFDVGDEIVMTDANAFWKTTVPQISFLLWFFSVSMRLIGKNKIMGKRNCSLR